MSPSEDLHLFCFSGTTLIVWWSFAGTAILGALLIGVAFEHISSQIALAIGVLQLLFLIYVAYASHRSRTAQKREEANEIDDARSLADQCMATHEMMTRTLTSSPADYGTRIALNHMASEIRLFISRYRRYLGTKAVRAVLEAENTIMRACLSGSQELPRLIMPLGERIMLIKSDILDVEHHSLRDKRARV